jgi:hypothetical protein
VRIDGKQGYPLKKTYFREGIKRDLLAGTNIIVDRYVYSGVAFSAAKVISFGVTDDRDSIIRGVGIRMLDFLDLMRLSSCPCRVMLLR